MLPGAESRLVTEALIEVSGVRKSCVTESSRADFSRSPSREASVFPSSSTARARSKAMAISVPNASSVCAGKQPPGNSQAADRPRSHAHRHEAQAAARRR